MNSPSKPIVQCEENRLEINRLRVSEKKEIHPTWRAIVVHTIHFTALHCWSLVSVYVSLTYSLLLSLSLSLSPTLHCAAHSLLVFLILCCPANSHCVCVLCVVMWCSLHLLATTVDFAECTEYSQRPACSLCSFAGNSNSHSITNTWCKFRLHFSSLKLPLRLRLSMLLFENTG